MKKVSDFCKKACKFCADNRLSYEFVKNACYETIRIYPVDKFQHENLLKKLSKFRSFHVSASRYNWDCYNSFCGYINVSDKEQNRIYHETIKQRNNLCNAFFAALHYGNQDYAKKCEYKYAKRKGWFDALKLIYGEEDIPNA